MARQSVRATRSAMTGKADARYKLHFFTALLEMSYTGLQLVGLLTSQQDRVINMMVMEHDKRQHPRYESEGIEACITFEYPPNPPFSTNGDVIDISCTGIKIKLVTPLPDIFDAKIKIMLVLPGSGTPITIKGIVKHQTSPCECGLQYENSLPGEALNDLIIECFKPVQAISRK